MMRRRTVSLSGLALILSACSSQSAPTETTTTISSDIVSRQSSVAGYQAAAQYSAAQGGLALLVQQEGNLLFETYTNGFDANRTNLLASGTKSFNSALAILAIQDPAISLTLSERVADTLTEWQTDPDKSLITVLDLLSLSAGLNDLPDYKATNVPNLDTYQLALNAISKFPPQRACIYSASNFQNFANLFERKSQGQDPVTFLQTNLFDPLGIQAVEWQRDAKNKPQMAGGASLTARDWIKYGQLFLQEGVWQGSQLLNQGLVQLSTTYPNPTFLGYGLTWWLNSPYGNSYNPGIDQIPQDGLGTGTQIAPSAPEDMYMAAGTGNQRLYVIPSLRFVVVRFGQASSAARQSWSDEQFLKLLLS